MIQNTWKKKLTECQSDLMLVVDQEMKNKGYEIQPGIINQCYVLNINFYDHDCKITFDIINRRWISALIFCVEPITIDNDPPVFVETRDLDIENRPQNVGWKIECKKKFESYECLDRLIGQKVIKLLFNEEKNSFAFLLDTLRLEVFYCQGDCCSTSWIEHLSGLNNLLHHTVNKINYIDIDTDRDSDEWGEKETLIYRFDIYTEAGICTMEMRNHSNGYYSGQLTHEDDNDNDYYGDEFAEAKIECKEDF